MREKVRLLAVFTLILLLSILPAPRIADAQPSQGNWVVTGIQIVQNESIVLNGNLTVQSGGSLTLSSVSLTVNGQRPGQYSIYVAPGGSLYINNSTITAANLQEGFSFVVAGTHFVMTSSSIHGVGWCLVGLSGCSDDAGQGRWLGGTTYPYGLKILTDNAVITNNLISMNTGGIWLVGTNETIANNRFVSDSLFSIHMQYVSNSKILSNYVNQSTSFPADIVAVFHSNNNLFSNNVISNTLQLVGGNEVGGFGLDLGASWNNIISGNQISGTVPVWLQGGSSDNTVMDNYLAPNEVGVYILAGVSNRVTDNTIRIVGQSEGGGPPAAGAFYLSSAHNSTIAGNLIHNGQGGGLSMYGTSGSRILNNIFETPTFLTMGIFGSQNNTISGNRMANTETGISLDYLSNGNAISDNEVVANGTLFNDCCNHGISVKDSSGNSIFQNNFVGGNLGPYDNGNNSWYSNGKGNYWSLYNGTDSDGDGIIDKPYRIPPNGVDLYPLVNPVVIKPVPVSYAAFAALPPNVAVPNLGNMAIMNKKATYGGANVNVEKSMTIENSVVTLGTNGSFTVNLAAGATLLIDNSTVYWEQGAAWVPKGSNLTIVDSNLIVGQKQQFWVGMTGAMKMVGSSLRSTANGFGWIVQNRGPAPDSSALINESSFYSYGTASSDTDGPLALFSLTNITVDNSYFAGCQNGFRGGDYNGGSETFRFVNNTFLDVQIPLFYTDTDNYNPGFHYNSTLYIKGNNFNSNVFVIGGNITFTGNIVTSGGQGISGNRIELTENDFYSPLPIQARTISVSGNYWSNYAGKDSDLDGIGDTPYTSGGVTDNFPFMSPNGWLTKFYLTLQTNLPASTAFQINGTSFSVGQKGVATLRLGYVAAYTVALPQTLKLANGTTLGFSRWGDGVTSLTRTLKLSANSTLVATYVLEAPITTTTTSTSTISMTSSTSTNTSSSTSTTTTTSSSSPTSAFSSSTLTTSSSSSTLTSSIAATSSQATTTLELALAGGAVVVLVVLGALFLRRRSP